MNLKQALLIGFSIFPLISSADKGRFYLGAQGGLTYLNANMKAEGENAGAPASGSINIHLSKSAFTSGMLGGYYKQFNNFFFIGEAFGRLGDVNETKDKLNIVDPDTLLPAQTDFSIRFKRKYTLGVGIKVGKFFDNNFGAFLSLGILNSQFRVNFSDPATPQSNSQKKNLYGIAPGAGLIYKLGEKLVFRGDYAYEMYSSFKSRNLDTSGVGNSLNLKPTPRYHTFLLSISYLFGDK